MNAAASGLRHAIEALSELYRRGCPAKDKGRRNAAERDLGECSRRLADALAEMQRREGREQERRRDV